jgi:hypothetical protein
MSELDKVAAPPPVRTVIDVGVIFLRETAMRVLPRWDKTQADGCSVPQLLRIVVPQETAAQCSVCERHDEAYYYGGSRKDRRAADKVFRNGLIAARMFPPKAWSYWFLVRIGGAPWFRVKGVSWSFGGDCFRYSSGPARPPGDAS